MASKYLDFVGLSRFLDKLKGLFAPKKQGVEYINGTQTASTNVWTGETTDNELYEGKMIAYRLPYAGTSSGATLNLTFANGTTSGAKNVYLSTSTRMTTHVAAGNTVILVYHEANVIGSTTYQGWWMDAYYNSNDSAAYVYYSGSRCGTTVTNCPPTCLFLTQEETALLPTWAGKTNATAATHVMTTEEFDPFGRIYYKSSTAYNAGTLVGVATYLTNDVDLRYAFNTNGFDLLDNGVGTTIYMVCKPTANGKAVLHDNPITKTLPIEDDGLLYVYLGRSYSSITINLMLDHPVYMFDAEAGEAISIDRSYLLDRDKNRIVTEADPYIYRQTGDGKAIGDIEVLDKIVGGTVCWNQMLTDISDSGWSAYSSNYGTVSYSNNELVYTLITVGSDYYVNAIKSPSFDIVMDHVYAVAHDIYVPYDTIAAAAYFNGYTSQAVTSGWNCVFCLFKAIRTGTASNLFGIDPRSGSWQVGDAYKIKNPRIHDFTQMFGSTIADYIYSLEQATAGAGVTWFRRYFPNEYYAYNPGELISVTGLQEHKTVGKNLFDESVLDGLANYGVTKRGDSWVGSVSAWISTNVRNGINDTLHFFENTSYAIIVNGTLDSSGQTTNVKIRFVYADGSYADYNDSKIYAGSTGTIIAVSDSTKTLSKVSFTYGSGGTSSIFTVHQMSVSIFGTETTYEPYVSHSTALDPTVKLRGIFSLDSSNKLTSNGDIWTPDGKIERRYGEVDFGTLTYSTRKTGDVNKLLSASLPYAYLASYSYLRPWLLENYTQGSPTSAAALMQIVDTADIGAYSYNAGTDIETLTIYLVIPKDSNPEGKLIYELAEPVIEDAPTYSSMQKADPAGTEEFVSNAEVKIPVGHSTRYMLAPKLYDETQGQIAELRTAVDGEYISAKHEQQFTPTQQLQARENIGATGIEWIQSTQTATTRNWTGVSRDARLYDGKIICYRLSQSGSGNASLNLTLANGDETGPIPVYWNSTTRVTTHQVAGAEWLYVYHEDYISSVDNSHKGPGWWSLTRAYYDNSIAYISRDNTPPKVKSTLYRYMLCFSDVDTQLIPASDGNNNTGTTKTITTDSFDPFGRIYYYASTTTVNAGNRPAENVMNYAQYTLDIRFSFNTGSTLTDQMPVYVACVPQSDGRVKLAENPIVQTIPLDSEEDGLIYIYLGQARSTASICLNAVHDIYKVYNGVVYNIKTLML